MSSYLNIAEKVLSEVREPMSARQIMAVAYRLQLVPADLYGKTQHKTLHARLSEDIAARRSRSLFARVAPGRFLLRASLSDTRLPESERQEYKAPLRSDQLKRFYTLSVSKDRALQLFKTPRTPAQLAEEKSISYRRYDRIEGGRDFLAFRVLIVFRRGHHVLVRRKRGESDALDLQQPSLAMVGFIKREDYTLFSVEDLGIAEASIRTLSERLILPLEAIEQLKSANPTSRIHLTLGPSEERQSVAAVVAITVYAIPDTALWDSVLQETREYIWRESSFKINDVQQFDEWSRLIIEKGLLEGPCLSDIG